MGGEVTYAELEKMYLEAAKGELPNLTVTSLPKDPIEREQKLQFIAWVAAGCPREEGDDAFV